VARSDRQTGLLFAAGMVPFDKCEETSTRPLPPTLRRSASIWTCNALTAALLHSMPRPLAPLTVPLQLLTCAAHHALVLLYTMDSRLLVYILAEGSRAGVDSKAFLTRLPPISLLLPTSDCAEMSERASPGGNERLLPVMQRLPPSLGNCVLPPPSIRLQNMRQLQSTEGFIIHRDHSNLSLHASALLATERLPAQPGAILLPQTSYSNFSGVPTASEAILGADTKSSVAAMALANASHFSLMQLPVIGHMQYADGQNLPVVMGPDGAPRVILPHPTLTVHR
jgi:hypothetical protein